MPLSHGDVLKAVNLGRASGRWYLLPRLARALIRAALSYTRGGGLIRSPYVVETLVPIMNFLMVSKDSDLDASSCGGWPPAASYKSRETGHPRSDGVLVRRMVLDALKKLRRRPDAVRRIPRLTMALLKAVVRAPVKFVSGVLLSAIVKSLRIVGEALSPRVRLIRMGLRMAWSASMTAYRWGNREAVSWRRDEGFAMYWGAMIQSWPKSMPRPSTTI